MNQHIIRNILWFHLFSAAKWRISRYHFRHFTG